MFRPYISDIKPVVLETIFQAGWQEPMKWDVLNGGLRKTSGRRFCVRLFIVLYASPEEIGFFQRSAFLSLFTQRSCCQKFSSYDEQQILNTAWCCSLGRLFLKGETRPTVKWDVVMMIHIHAELRFHHRRPTRAAAAGRHCAACLRVMTD